MAQRADHCLGGSWGTDVDRVKTATTLWAQLDPCFKRHAVTDVLSSAGSEFKNPRAIEPFLTPSVPISAVQATAAPPLGCCQHPQPVHLSPSPVSLCTQKSENAYPLPQTSSGSHDPRLEPRVLMKAHRLVTT